MQSVQSKRLFTIGDVAHELEVSRARVDYAVAAYNIPPAQRAGIIRLFDDAGVEAIRRAVRRIHNRRECAL